MLARRDLSEEQYAQEFECSFDAAVIGAYYGKLMMPGRGRRPHRRRALRSGGAGVDRVGPRHPRRHRDLVRAGRRPRDPDHRLLRGVRRRPRPLRPRAQRQALRLCRATSCRTTRRPRSSAPARAGSRCWKASGSRASRSRRCTGSRTASTRCACSSRAAGSTRKKCARGLDALKLYRADYDDKPAGAAAAARCTTGPRTRRTRSAISR